MGLIELPRAEPGQLIVTPHPLLLDGQRNVVWEARPGESLYALLMRNMPELDVQPWAVSIGGLPVERHLWQHVFPKAGQVIEVRGGVGKSALAVVAMIALTYFTMGAGAAWIAPAFGVAAGGMAAAAIGAGLFIAGSMLINKVLTPKQAKSGSQQQDSVYSISGARNQLRPYEPLPMLFGRARITPDLLSKPYAWYEGNDQYLGLLLCAGINVGRVEAFYNGDTVLSNYEGVQVYHAGYSQMPDQNIPLYSNADTIDGAELEKSKAWVERTTSADTVRIQINLEYMLGGMGGGGKGYDVYETIEAQYRAVGTTAWLPLVSQRFKSKKMDAKRATMSRDVARGQYEVRVHMLGEGNYNGGNTHYNDFQWTTLTSVQADDADYTGLSRTGIRIKATGQLNGSPDELRAVGHADPIPVWNGTEWVAEESSNPAAHILAYARGIRREGRLLGGMALADEQIDIESLKAFSLHCAANGYTYDYFIKDARNHDQVLSTIALAGFGQTTWAGGRLGVVWAAQDQPLSGVVNMATIKKGQFQVDYNLSNAADGIEYTYLDAATWETKTLRVPAPGITTMLNPAQVAGEGVTSEAHAACLARWHLAQSLYQYKDIGYSTDIEHMSYQRLSLLAMQHDMTQWGFGGRVAAAVNAAGTVTLTLDEPVPAPATGNAYIGLRIPGERVYRVMRVRTFTGESNTVELLDPWPADADLPGNTPDNPAHDTLWVYDFKQTPGKRVRVVSIEPESDLKGAAVRVVEEGPEFWNYVLTGEYIPPPNDSLLPTRPVASNLRVTEQQVVQGDTQFTELTATFDITGPVGNILVLAAGQEQELLEVAQTQTRTATWRIPQADVYSIVVRPFSPDGEAGVAVSVTYATAGADVPPVLVDLFDVQERSGGVRLYTWGWLADTMRSADFAGVEIRYTAGHVTSPVWDDMTPVGDTGYHTAAFEAVVPESGQWTFACRSRNTSGELSTGMRIVQRTLGKNLGQNLSDITQEQVAQQGAIDAAEEAALLAGLKAAQALALMGTEYDPDAAYAANTVVYKDARMYRAKQAVPINQPPPNVTYWQDVGTVTQAQGTNTQALQQLRTDVDEQGVEFAAAITDVRRAAGVGENLIIDPSFAANDAMSAGWGQVAVPWVRNFGSAAYRPVGINSYGAQPSGIPVGVWSYLVGKPVRVKPNTTYCVSIYAATDRASGGCGVLLLDQSGLQIDDKASSSISSSPGDWTQPTYYLRRHLFFTTSASTFYVQPYGRVTNATAGNPYAVFFWPQLEEAAPGQTEPTPYKEGSVGNASATVAVKVAQDAQITHVTDVNGNISGTYSVNDGVRSSYSILATVFRVISTLTGMGMEWQDGYLRIWKGAAQLILGHTFGSGDLVFWYGPNIGAGNCTKGNAIIWFDTAGSAYFGGTLSAGVRKNAAQSTQVSRTATVETGQFGTAGGPKVVTASFGYLNNFTTASNLGTSDTPLSATLYLERSIAGGAWSIVSSQSVSGTRAYLGFEPGVGYSYGLNIGGSVNSTDNTAGTSNFNYRTRLADAAGWPLSRPEGGAGALGTQSTSVLSVEQ